MIKLWSWQCEGEARPNAHWHVDYDYRLKRKLSVLFPFNFVASGWCIIRNLLWQFEQKLRNAGDKWGCEAWRAGFRDGEASRDVEDPVLRCENIHIITENVRLREENARLLKALFMSAPIDPASNLQLSDNMKALLDKNIAHATGDFERHWPQPHGKELDAGNAPVGL